MNARRWRTGLNPANLDIRINCTKIIINDLARKHIDYTGGNTNASPLASFLSYFYLLFSNLILYCSLSEFGVRPLFVTIFTSGGIHASSGLTQIYLSTIGLYT